MSVPVTLAVRMPDGTAAQAVGYAEGRLSIICAEAQAIGRPLSLKVSLTDGEVDLQGKSISSKVRSDGRFDVRLKLSSLRREHREQLERVFAAPN